MKKLAIWISLALVSWTGFRLIAPPRSVASEPLKTATGAARLAMERLLNLDEGCAGTLPAATELIAVLEKVEFVDVRTAAGNQTQDAIAGNGSLVKLKDTSLGARAFVLIDVNRAIYPKAIFLRPNFFSESSRRVQQSVVLHELLHIYFNAGDTDLCRKYDMTCGAFDSYKLTSWIEGHCFAPAPDTPGQDIVAR